MNNEFMEKIDLAISESSKPVIIEGNVGDGKVNYIRSKYETIICSMPFFAENLIGQSFGETRVSPDWYKDLCELCAKNQEKRCLIVFDELDKAKKEDVSTLLEEVVFNQKNTFPLPSNAEIVCMLNAGYENTELGSVLQNYLQDFTVVIGRDELAAKRR